MMNARISKRAHLGERQFQEYPQILAEEWGATRDVARSLLSPARVLAALVLLGLAAGTLLLLR